MFDAYTVKKVLPRLIAAVVLIQLSWFIFTGMIQLTASISYGIEGLIIAPFGGEAELTIPELLARAGLGSGSAVLGLATVAIAGTIAAGGLLALGITVILALLVGFVVLVLRKLLLIGLLVLSPIAIVAWILPGTERFWKIWWDNFSKLLLMFPLILVMYAAGRVFASIAAVSGGSGSGPGTGLIDMVIILVAVFAPIALIPLTYKAAGAGLGALAGAVKQYPDRWTQAARERGKKKSAERRKDLHTRASESRLFNPNGRFGKLNNLASTIADPKNAARIALGTRGGKSLMSQIGQSKWEHTEKMAGALSKAGFNDKALEALMDWDGSEADLNKKIDRMADGDGNDKIGAQLLRNNAGFLLDAHKSEEYGRASIAGAAGLTLASQGFASPEQIASTATKLNSEFDGLGNTFKTQAELAGAQRGGLSKPGQTVSADGQGGFKAAGIGLQIKRLKSLGVQDIATAKGPQLSGYEEAYKTALSGQEYTDENGKRTTLKPEERTAMEETLLQAHSAYTNPDVKGKIRGILKSAHIASGMSEEQANAAVDNQLSRARGMAISPDEAANQSQQQPPPEVEGQQNLPFGQ